MAVVQVAYKLGTKYIIESMEGKFRNILHEAAKNGDTVDLCFAKLCPSCAAELRNYYGKVELINSVDAELDSILKQNTVNSQQVKEVYPNLPIPKDPTFKAWMQAVKELPKGSQWTVNLVSNSEAVVAYVVLLILKRPDIEWDIAGCMQYLYDFVVDEWRIHAVQHTNYIEFYNRAVIPLAVDGNGKLGTALRGIAPVRQYIDMHAVLPADFGSVDCVKFDGDQPVGEWRDVVHKCVRALTSKSIGVKHLANYLKLRKE